MKKFGKYIVCDMLEQTSYIVTDATAVAIMMGVSDRTVRRWFKGEKNMIIVGHHLLARNYKIVKTRRWKKSHS